MRRQAQRAREHQEEEATDEGPAARAHLSPGSPATDRGNGGGKQARSLQRNAGLVARPSAEGGRDGAPDGRSGDRYTQPCGKTVAP
ncbi:MAG: hypothetical protein A2Y78_04015 [Acidobacteria bacterium RBG_13_68_16]|nr:MAG: hypothetical protein A2Y78_04015 [Acidobacteria bacterium RBG_13_68_16]